jgi:hypothetical protein
LGQAKELPANSEHLLYHSRVRGANAPREAIKFAAGF